MSCFDRSTSRRTLLASSVVASAAAALPSNVRAQATPVALDIPDTAAGRQLAWVLSKLDPNAGQPSFDEVNQHFSAAFLAQIPAEQMAPTIAQLAAEIGPISILGFEDAPAETELSLRFATRDGEPWLLVLQTEPAAPFKIDGLFFQPASNVDPVSLSGFEDLEQRWTAFAPEHGFSVVEISADSTTPVFELNADKRLPIGSAFKLYVLGALASEIEAGRLSWDQMLAVDETAKSLPSGEMQNEVAGTQFPLRVFAEKMISISDNTATDHLIQLLGRETVEAILAPMGHDDPASTLPFLNTRELFALKMSASSDLQALYISADTSERRALLEGEVAALPLSIEMAESWTAPRLVQSLEWFASCDDLTSAMAWLSAAAQRPGLEPIGEILSANPPVNTDDTIWTFTGFKGGSELGVLNATWLARRADDRTFAFSGSLTNPTAVLDESPAVLTAAGVFGLLAVYP